MAEGWSVRHSSLDKYYINQAVSWTEPSMWDDLFAENEEQQKWNRIKKINGLEKCAVLCSPGKDLDYVDDKEAMWQERKISENQ